MSKFKVVAIIQARMNSTRLPGKILKKILEKPMLQYLIDRVSRARLIDELVVATTNNPLDDDIVEFCKGSGINYFRGSEDDVLSRYYQVSKKYKANCIVRICSDSPLVDPFIIDKIIRIFIDSKGGYDYVSNTLDQTYPLGMNTEVFSYSALENAFLNHTKEYEKEHVTPYIYTHMELFKIYKEQLENNYSHLRLTIDEEKDFILVRKIIEKLFPDKPFFDLSDIINLYKTDPKLFLINSHVKQKGIN
jgi:spore coat polysaccharide biosynthesis protein SpsF